MQAVLLQELAVAFPANRMTAAKALRGLYQADPASFLEETLRILPETAMSDPKEVPGAMYLLALLLTLPDALALICDPQKFSTLASLALVYQIKTLDPHVETKLARLAVQLQPYETDRQAALGTRILQVLGAASDPFTTLPALRQLLQCNHPRIRSQAALLIGRISRNPQWAKRFDQREDPRVVANAIESLWGSNSQGAKDAFREACRDPRNRVAGNGAVGLYLADEPDAAAEMFRLGLSRDDRFRATLAWCMGRTGDLRFLPRLRALAQDPVPTVRTPALRALTMVTQRLRELRAAPRLAMEIRSAEFHGGNCILRVVLEDGGPQTRGFTALNFAIIFGDQLAEQYSVEELQEGSETVYKIVSKAATIDHAPVKVELNHERGCGAAAVAAENVEEAPAPGVRLETCPDSASSSAPSVARSAIRLPRRRPLHLGRIWHG